MLWLKRDELSRRRESPVCNPPPWPVNTLWGSLRIPAHISKFVFVCIAFALRSGGGKALEGAETSVGLLGLGRAELWGAGAGSSVRPDRFSNLVGFRIAATAGLAGIPFLSWGKGLRRARAI